MPSGASLAIDENESLLTALKEAGYYVKSSCGGHASCTDCIVKILTGEDNVNAPGFDELQLIGNVFHITKERLSCQTRLTGDVTIDISNHDLKKDQEKTKSKTASFSKSKSKSKNAVKVRRKDEIEEIKKEREEQWSEKQLKNDEWHKHWEKTDDTKIKRLGGGKRPKEFRTDHIDHERDAILKDEAMKTRVARERYEQQVKQELETKAAAVKEATAKNVETSTDTDFVQPENKRESNPERKSFRKKD